MENKPKETTGILSRGVIFVIIIIITIIITIILLLFSDGNSTENSENHKQTAQTIIIKTGKIKTLYRFEDFEKKIVCVEIKSDAEFYPKGGKVKIIPPSQNFYISTPGTHEVRPREKRGTFSFESYDSLAWGIEIWQ